MPTTTAAPTLTRLFAELVDGTPERGGAFILNSGDVGLLGSLDRLSADAASRSIDGGATIAAHAQHLRFGLSLMNRWASEGGNPFADARWDEAWKTSSVAPSDWQEIRNGLRDEAHRWLAALSTPREASDLEFSGMVGSIAHLAYHLGAIREESARERAARERGRSRIRYDLDVTSLVRYEQPSDNSVAGLRSTLAEREAALAQRAADLARDKSDLAAFGISYRQDVGRLHEELDELELAIAEAELGELSKRASVESGNPEAPSVDPQPEPRPRYTSDVVRKLFRDVAKTVHPDLAGDAHTRGHRHTLMVEANRAYAMGDEEQLRRILEAWERSPEAVQGGDTEAIHQRLTRRIAQVEEQLDGCAADLATLRDSALWKLKAMVDEAAGRGKDLVGEMVRRLNRDIMVARNRLDAIRWNP